MVAPFTGPAHQSTPFRSANSFRLILHIDNPQHQTSFSFGQCIRYLVLLSILVNKCIIKSNQLHQKFLLLWCGDLLVKQMPQCLLVSHYDKFASQ